MSNSRPLPALDLPTATAARPLRVLMVCMGNICRSPTAHGVLERKVADAGLADRIQVDSAGTHDYHVGRPPDERAQAHALGRGVDLSGQRARQLTRQDFADFDLVLVMDDANEHAARPLCPPDQRHRLRRLDRLLHPPPRQRGARPVLRRRRRLRARARPGRRRLRRRAAATGAAGRTALRHGAPAWAASRANITALAHNLHSPCAAHWTVRQMHRNGDWRRPGRTHTTGNGTMDALNQGANALFVLLGGIMVLAMHAGFAFLELGTVRKKNQVNALVKILVDFSVSTVVYFVVGYGVAYGTHFFIGADQLAAKNGYELVKFFFLLTFAAAIPAIISGGIAERAKFWPQLIATAVIVGFIYPFFEGIAWNQHFGVQGWIKSLTGVEFHDFAGSVVVHAVGGWIALPAVLLLGARYNRYRKDGGVSAHPPSNIPFLALGAWILVVGWFGFNVMSAQTLDKISGLVAVNSLMAMVGGTLAALALGKNDPGFVHNGPLAGLVAVCAGSDLMHPMGALVVGAVAGALFVFMFTLVQNRWKIDDVLGVWPLHGLCGTWGGLAAGIFGTRALGGLGGVHFGAQLIGTLMGVGWALLGGWAVYGVLRKLFGLRLSQEEEFNGADLSIHRIGATPEREVNW